MNILGIGPAELLIILVLMLMVAGPKRMIQWAYIFGVYMGKLRVMWQETSAVIRRELEAAGLEPEIVDSLSEFVDPRTRKTAAASRLDKLVGDMKKPLEEPLRSIDETVKQATEVSPLVPKQPAAGTSSAEGNGASGQARPTPPSVTSDSSDTPGTYDAWTPN